MKFYNFDWNDIVKDMDKRGSRPPKSKDKLHNLTDAEVMKILNTKGHVWDATGCSRCDTYLRDLMTGQDFHECIPFNPNPDNSWFPGWDGIGE